MHHFLIKYSFIIIFMCSIFNISSFGSDFKETCLSCHDSSEAPSLENVYYRYLLLYSSKERIVKRMYEFLTNPTKELSSMPKGVILNFGVHPKMDMSNLREVILAYLNEYEKKRVIEFE